MGSPGGIWGFRVGARSAVGLRGSRLRLALRWVRVRRAAAAPIVSPPGGIVLCFALILWEIKGGVLCLAGLGTALLLRAAPAAMLEGLRGASSTPGPGGSTRWGNSPHEHGVRATPKEKPFSRRVPAPRTWQAGATSTGMGAGASRCTLRGASRLRAGRCQPQRAQVWTRTRARMRCSVPRGDSSFIPVRR